MHDGTLRGWRLLQRCLRGPVRIVLHGLGQGHVHARDDAADTVRRNGRLRRDLRRRRRPPCRLCVPLQHHVVWRGRQLLERRRDDGGPEQRLWCVFVVVVVVVFVLLLFCCFV